MLIYQIKNLINNKSYIGQTQIGLCFRFCNKMTGHWTRAFKQNYNNYLYNSIRKYGKENFDIIILEDNIATKEQLDEREIYHIKELNTIYPNGYNLNGGGSLKFTDNTIVRKWINNGKINKCIKIYELDTFLNNGYKLGRVNSAPVKGRIMINNNIKNKYILKSDINKYINEGYNIGAIKGYVHSYETKYKYSLHKKDKIIVNDGTKCYYIEKYLLNIYLNNGYKLGRINQFTLHNRKLINNGVMRKFVKCNELDDYLHNGWKLGKL